MSKGRYPGVQAAYDRGGFGAVWKFAHGHGLKRWIRVRNWSRRRVAQAKDPSGFKKANAVYEKKVRHLKKLKHEHQADGKRIVNFDGRPCPGWIVRTALTPARASGIWRGTCISGVRTVAESIALCQAMCHADSCPGTCAGAATNHTCPVTHTCKAFEGAVDCLDPAGLEAYCRSHGVGLIGDGIVLSRDVNHFSHAGN